MNRNKGYRIGDNSCAGAALGAEETCTVNVYVGRSSGLLPAYLWGEAPHLGSNTGTATANLNYMAR